MVRRAHHPEEDRGEAHSKSGQAVTVEGSPFHREPGTFFPALTQWLSVVRHRGSRQVVQGELNQSLDSVLVALPE